MTRQRPIQHGYTLVEVIVTLAIMSTVVLGLGSAIMLSARAAPSVNDALGLASDAGRAIEEMTDDLASAVLFESVTATGARFQVADRDNDATNETIEYAWSGVMGEPLTRTLNGGFASVLIDQVDGLAMSYLTSPPSPTSDAYNRSPEEVFWGNTSASSSTADATGMIRLGQSFLPTIQGGALGWIVTSVEMDLSGSGSATYVIEVRSYIGGVVGDTVYASASIRLDQLGEYVGDNGFELIPLGNPVLIAPSDEACVLFYRAKGTGTMRWGLRFAMSAQGGTMLYSSDAGSTWLTSTFSHRALVVYGQQVFAGDAGVPPDLVDAVFVELTVTGETTPMRVGVRLPGGATAP